MHESPTYALTFDGVNDTAKTATDVTIAASTDFDVRVVFKQDSTSNFSALFSVTVGSTKTVFRVNTGNDFLLRTEANAAMTFTISAGYVVGTEYDWTIQRRTGVIDIVDTQTTLSVVTATKIDNGALIIQNIGNWSGSSYFNGYISRLTVDATNDWDATASSHASGTPILTDTIGANNWG